MKSGMPLSTMYHVCHAGRVALSGSPPRPPHALKDPDRPGLSLARIPFMPVCPPPTYQSSISEPAVGLTHEADDRSG
jgi:hypothetical protein